MTSNEKQPITMHAMRLKAGWAKDSLRIVQKLLREKGIYKYEIFELNLEGSTILPGRILPVSGHLLTKQGKIYHFWLDWDEIKGNYSLGDISFPDGSVADYWTEIDPSEVNEDDASFKKAKKKLGLS